MSGSARVALLTTHERDEELLTDRWSPNATWPRRLRRRTHKHARAHTGTEQPQSGASKSPDGPSVSPLCPAGCRLVVPTDRWPNSPHTPWQAGAVTASPVEDQMLIAARSCLVALPPLFL